MLIKGRLILSNFVKLNLFTYYDIYIRGSHGIEYLDESILVRDAIQLGRYVLNSIITVHLFTVTIYIHQLDALYLKKLYSFLKIFKHFKKFLNMF